MLPISDNRQQDQQTQPLTRQQPAPPADHDLLDAYSRTVIDVAGTVGPAVIGVTGPPTRHPNRRNQQGGSGSGVVIAPDGLALTNSHVVNGRTRLSARTTDGDRIDADVIGDDPGTDLALLRLRGADLAFAKLEIERDPIPGQLAVALGSPFGLHSTVSAGIVSATGRSLRGRDGRLIDDVLQHTAPINPGNSGGPLVDTRGNVLGLNTAIIAAAQSVGFAVSARTANWVIRELLSYGRVRRISLAVGAAIVPIPRWIRRKTDILNERGILVVSLDDNGPAARAGVQTDDVIIAINDRITESVDDIHRILSQVEPAGDIHISVLRDGESITLAVRAHTDT